ncbi:MAG: hypothetical protein COZ70_02650 [Deltaproteobacteria bacterium CG_4_8_14_3_um_filter_51_11]|nr:hypothetical protein [bacterium]OIP43168.1 MAG: hypothetical protein AUK25_02135 [Desulfobacteraceae bacterium CG2_30_51_40]PIP45072.1 MAG: hypothetical protein COX16_14995 [Deltaproteobacteria bacterium CG23_combo_of_CG06-09_8_20_14_all_51_20]PIX20623.1 MAG: hypothetical protein COZ70_02650 [Deltaproteobacteria bacterium CG_4_8_14_3_um_filter_51_11]PIY25307.1 MAG: hypothetical protein COZ11_05610 [Deltaproteobacteria bacterium CG_4_10_14_3_um_filter_51_14]PJB37034.1 MAG: hypothetical prote
MTKKLFLLFSHSFTRLQEKDAISTLGVERIVALPPELQALWSDIPPGLDSLECYLEPLKAWIEKSARPGDFVLVQGDFGACYLIVRFSMSKGLCPIYSTTERKAAENVGPDGTVRLTHEFMHVRFRRYGA